MTAALRAGDISYPKMVLTTPAATRLQSEWRLDDRVDRDRDLKGGDRSRRAAGPVPVRAGHATKKKTRLRPALSKSQQWAALPLLARASSTSSSGVARRTEIETFTRLLS